MEQIDVMELENMDKAERGGGLFALCDFLFEEDDYQSMGMLCSSYTVLPLVCLFVFVCMHEHFRFALWLTLSLLLLLSLSLSLSSRTMTLQVMV